MGTLISIPFWSDFIFRYKVSCRSFCVSFQSHFGLILSLQQGRIRITTQLHFNPILVWFYLNYALRLDECIWFISIPFWSDFIAASLMSGELPDMAFQSHFGLILSVCLSWTGLSLRQFQSHFGLILSLLCSVRFLLCSLYFNPILVWFYPQSIVRVASLSEKYFNPILVWFYPLVCVHTKELLYQISIPFWSDFIASKSFKIFWRLADFNPILVWFYLLQKLYLLYRKW